jgi:hypothetical protein
MKESTSNHVCCYRCILLDVAVRYFILLALVVNLWLSRTSQLNLTQNTESDVVKKRKTAWDEYCRRMILVSNSSRTSRK